MKCMLLFLCRFLDPLMRAVMILLRTRHMCMQSLTCLHGIRMAWQGGMLSKLRACSVRGHARIAIQRWCVWALQSNVRRRKSSKAKEVIDTRRALQRLLRGLCAFKVALVAAKVEARTCTDTLLGEKFSFRRLLSGCLLPGLLSLIV